jgi:hypothetical protein
MPLLRYFLFVGGALVGLLLLANAFLPQVPTAEVTSTSTANDLPTIRIRSAQKWPRRVVIDTSLPTIIPPQSAAPEPAVPAATAAVPAHVKPAEAYAQLAAAAPKKDEPKPRRKHRIARRKAAPPMVMVAQQRPFGFGFFGSSW